MTTTTSWPTTTKRSRSSSRRAARDVEPADQSAAIRWWADTAIVDEIYVQRAFRRTHLGTKVIYTASGFHQHHRWPDRLHSDGRRTDMGQRFVAGLRHPDRIAEWTDLAADMDPSGPT